MKPSAYEQAACPAVGNSELQRGSSIVPSKVPSRTLRRVLLLMKPNGSHFPASLQTLSAKVAQSVQFPLHVGVLVAAAIATSLQMPWGFAS